MSGKTKSAWWEKVWNPVVGCSKVSEGCRHCYAETMARRLKAMGRPEYQDVVDEGRWTEKISMVYDRLETPEHWKKPRRIFVDSMGDLFFGGIPWEFMLRVWLMMVATPQHTYMVLTKRPDEMNTFLTMWLPYVRGLPARIKELLEKPLPNVWLGVSVEDQKAADKRIPFLLKTPAAKRFVSYEPALGLVDFEPFLQYEPFSENYKMTFGNEEWQGLDWVICGGESGPNARPMHPEWARAVRDQCQAAGAPFFFKQWGEWRPTPPASDGEGIQVAPGMERCGRKAAGRLLDGREWNELPNPQPLP